MARAYGAKLDSAALCHFPERVRAGRCLYHSQFQPMVLVPPVRADALVIALPAVGAQRSHEGRVNRCRSLRIYRRPVRAETPAHTLCMLAVRTDVIAKRLFA